MDEAKDNILDKVAAKGLILPKGPTNGFTRSYLEKNTNSSLFAKYLVKLNNKWDQKCAQENRAYAYIDQKSTNRNISEWRKQGKMAFDHMLKSKRNRYFLEKQTIKEVTIQNPIFKNDIKIYIHKSTSYLTKSELGPALIYFHGGGAVMMTAQIYSHIMVCNMFVPKTSQVLLFI